MKTLAGILYKNNKPLVIKNIEVPFLLKGQVLVKMLVSGICRSQLNEIQGFRGADKYLPHLLGHEGSGIVETVDSQVTKVKPGDYVVVSWIKSIGLDGGPVKYLLNGKIINSGPIATFSEYAVISENRLTKINRNVPPDAAALLGCAIATGAGIVLHKLKFNPRSSLIIFGAGGIGSSVILAAKMQKCSQILVVDINQKALDFVRKLGASHTILFKPDIILSDIHKILPSGADFVVEATGNKQAMETAIEATGDTGTIVIAGNLKADERITINPFDLIKGKKIYGTWGGETDPDKDFPLLVKAYEQKLLPLELLISQKIRLKDINSAFEKMKNHKSYGRILVDFT